MELFSNIASIITVFLFVLYIVGHIYTILQLKYSLSEQYQFEREFDFEGPKPKHYFELTENVGLIFSISSTVGIKEIRIYESVYSQEKADRVKGNLKGKLEKIRSNEKAYIKMEIPDTGDGCIIELVKFDGVEISFGVASSGYDGSLVQTNYSLKTTFKSFVYYMCT